MKHSITLKFLAIVLAALSLVAAVGCAAGIVALESAGLYISGLDALQDQAYDSIAREIGTSYTTLYAVDNLGKLPYTLRGSMYDDPLDRSDTEHWYVSLKQDGVTVSDDGIRSDSFAYTKEITLAPLYVIASVNSPEDMVPATTLPPDPTTADAQGEEKSSVYPEITVPEGYLYYSQERTLQNGSMITYYLYYYQAPEYTVTVQLREEVLENSSLYLLNAIYPHRYTFVLGLVLSLLVAAVCLVYLLNAAGHTADGTIRPGGLNRLPLDLYAGVAVVAIGVLVVLFFRLWEWVENEGPHVGNLTLMGVTLLGIAVIGIGFLFAFSAQVKTKGGFWWHHSIVGWCCGRIIAGIRLLTRGIRALTRMLPLMWQWLLATGCMALICVITFLMTVGYRHHSPMYGISLLLFVASILGSIALVLYGGYCLALLMKGAQRMSQGNLGSKIDTKYLRGNFRDFADQLNALSETAMIAAKKQMQSERMKSELITNVSHDIKTPLTSIINFVDLLQKPHTPEQQQEYLDVLARQSAQMKKLIQDLMELSKASSGNINVNLQQLDAAETVNQALGEFSDKLDSARLMPLFRSPAEPLMITADGRLVWRVLNNLLTNAVKYAMPGTRLYVDLLRVEDKVVLSLKNISREPLNIEAEELLERFVRGDASRKSEGSGLGLNIAQNLMEVQGGELQLLLDGDLFKVTLIFPSAEM